MTPTRLINGTIFDGTRRTRGYAQHQRICGFFFLRGINPGAVVSDKTLVTAPLLETAKTVTVSYLAIVLSEDEIPWLPLIPAGINCDECDRTHKLCERIVIEGVPWHEIATDPEAPAPGPDVEVQA